MDRFDLARARTCLAIVLAVMLARPVLAQPSSPSTLILGVPYDWSHRHLVYSAPANATQDARLAQDLRYWIQGDLRNVQGPALVEGRSPATLGRWRPGGASVRRDWAMSFPDSTALGTVGAGQFPAKYSFNINAAPSCANDFVVFNTGLAQAAGLAASGKGTFSGNPAANETATIGGTLVLTASASSNTGTNFQIGGTTTVTAANLAVAIARNGAGVGVTATSSAGTVIVTATTVGAGGNSIALVEGLTNFTWAAVTLSGGANAVPAIVAYNQLYSTQGSAGGLCNQNGPSVMWSYQTAASGTGAAVTSAILSLDGTKVAYVTSNSAGAVLHVLKWKSGQGTTLSTAPAPDQTLASGAAWSTCAAGNSCVANIAFGGSPQSTRSAPYYDYGADALYVGDNSGTLHKFTGVFNGTPAEMTTGWPIVVHSGINFLTGPVYDPVSGNIFMGDSSGRLSFVREVGSSVGSCASGSPPCVGTQTQSLGAAIIDAPIVDGTTGRVIAFEGADATDHGDAYQFDTGLTTASLRRAPIGGNGNGSGIYSGTFDNAYFNSPNGTGHLYVCGKASGSRDRPALHRITMTAGVMNTASDGSLTLVSGDGEECSPVTQIMNGSTEWIFFSVGNNGGAPTGASSCIPSGGCVMSLNLTALGSTWPPPAVSAAYPIAVGRVDGTANKSSTSGIVIDNASSAAQASSLYFSLTNNASSSAPCNGAASGGCVLKLTQSGLQ